MNTLMSYSVRASTCNNIIIKPSKADRKITVYEKFSYLH